MSLLEIYKRHRFKISITVGVVVLESILMILFPLCIGRAIQSVLDSNINGILELIALCLLVLIFGAIRRYYDTRLYARIYRKLAMKVVDKKEQKNTSSKVAHVNLLGELVEFFENSLPEIITSIIGLVGTLVIIFTLNITVLGICLAVIVGIMLVYLLSSKKTLRYNYGYNSELERQVDILSREHKDQSALHFKRLMKWNIKLSDLETFNFSIVWVLLAALLVSSIKLVGRDGALQFGIIFSIIMYVFQFMESTISLPYYYQQVLRLKDISSRLNKGLSL
ncbi:hypothetical protein EYV94_01405 [Puteibacter caeruleilacunae]|nr:hypothetical protein EYV94_01405 [Puteibacter caeruleilacunae]